MEIALAAYTKLVALAAADGEISAEERELLERYRERLGLEPDAVPLPRAPRIQPIQVPEELLSCTPAESAQIVRMLAKVALVDGPLNGREHRRLERVAEELGIGRTQLAGIVVEVEGLVQGARAKRREKRLWVGVGGLGLLTLFALWRPGGEPTAPPANSGAVEAPADVHDTFRELERELAPSVLLVRTLYTLRHLADSKSWEGYGSAFFVTPDGLLVTCKHVVEPWKWNADAAHLLDEGWELDRSRTHISAWSTGVEFRDAEGELDDSSAWSERRGELELVAMPPDRMERRRARLKDGSLWTGRLHANDDADLALLQARVERPVRALALRDPTQALSKFDEVMVLGYPEGAAPIEGRRLETSPSMGEVRKVQATVQLSAPIVHGNSGGPVLDPLGRVVGVAARTFGDSSMGACIRVDALARLLPAAPELARDARAWRQQGELEAARSCLRLGLLVAERPGVLARLHAELDELADDG